MIGQKTINSGQFEKGQKPWNAGSRQSYVCVICDIEFVRLQASPGDVVKYCSRGCMAKGHKGVVGKWNKGKKFSLERLKACQKAAKKGKECNFWTGGQWKKNASKRLKAMRSQKYKLWRHAVFIRDNWTCQICKERGVYLHAHHIRPWSLAPKLRYSVDNGQTLCRTCHKNTDSWGFKAVLLNHNHGRK